MLAWCDLCPDSELVSLLDWMDVWRPVLHRTDVCWLPSPEKEFYRRCTDKEVRHQRICASLVRCSGRFSSPYRIESEGARRSATRIVRFLLEEAAHSAPCPADTPPES